MKASPPPARPDGALDLARYPNVYDAAFSWDRSREAESYLEVAGSIMRRSPASVVELASGTGPLARLWAARGLETFGLDRSPAAIGRAQELGQGVVPASHWLLGDLRSFRLPHRVDLAVVPLDSLGYLVEDEDQLAFFRAARHSLAAGGVLAVDTTLHREGSPPVPIRNAWQVSLRPEGSLAVRWC
ncbi:MAG TPA: class I SAM-dependent methyltransferase, partial [Thermoplasmata archaeon]|nr:class I SAM-dependent methyltransferase [Thermoplasmata archaeon]